MRNYLRSAYRALWPVLFRRGQYKLFMKAAVGDIDLRVQRLASLSDYFSGTIQAIPLEAPFGESMLVVAPHQDDEAIGCGGAVALQVKSGRKARIAIVTDGAEGHDDAGIDRAALRDLRNEESRRAASLLGLEAPRFLNHTFAASRKSQEMAEAGEQIYQMLAEAGVDAVFTPYVLDGHPDHRTVNVIVANALKRIAHPVRVFGYEVWGLSIPNVVVPIDGVVDLKRRMLEQYSFANQALDYTNSTMGLNMYRSRLLPPGVCRHAEAFFEVPREEFIELVARVEAVGTRA